jgi:hypothetical protein
MKGNQIKNKKMNLKQNKKKVSSGRRNGFALAGGNYAPGGAIVSTPTKDTFRTTVRGAVTLTNSVVGETSNYFSMSFHSGTGFSNISTSIANFGANYRHFRVRSAVLRVMGITPLTSGGLAAVCYDGSPTTAVPLSLQSITNHVHSVIVPIGEVGEVHVPSSALPLEFKQVRDVPPDETNCCGVIQIVGINTAPTAAASVVVEVLLDIEFKGFQ